MSKTVRPGPVLSVTDYARLAGPLVVRTADCHLWMGAVGADGYGRIRIRERVLSAHAVAAQLVYGPAEPGSTLLHDCDVRICLRVEPGHLRSGTQRENVRQAVARGHQRGPIPGLADARGPAGASRAIQTAIRSAVDAGTVRPSDLADVLVRVVAAGFPSVDVVPLFDRPDPVPVHYPPNDFPADLFAVPTASVWSAAAETVPLFDLE